MAWNLGCGSIHLLLGQEKEMDFNTIHDDVLREPFIVLSWDWGGGGGAIYHSSISSLTGEKMSSCCKRCRTVVLLTSVALLSCFACFHPL